MEEIKELEKSSAPRLSIHIGGDGEVSFNQDCRSPEQFKELMEAYKKDEFFRDLVEASERAEKTGEDTIEY
jgi:hypothetical protein